ncbi:hypothetical protein EDC01DRAFT_610859 [Geopyxis carbonaria]|nr:hypothetical protein EDC01DRAFT_610859 [Geopyxis carbonaria]
MFLSSYTYQLNLSAAQKTHRRAALDWTGYTTVLSQLSILALVLLYRRLAAHAGSTSVLRRTEWLLREPVSLRYPQLRVWGDWVAVVLWTLWTALDYTGRTDADGVDYLHVTKALGQVAGAQLPLHFILGSKRGLLRVLGLSYEGRTNFLHRWLGRLMLALLIAHGVCYVKFFWDMGWMTGRFLEFDVLCGVAGLVMLMVLGTTANRFFRAWAYRLFYLLHITLAALLLPTLWLHVEHIRPYVLASAVIYAVDRTIRRLQRTSANASLRLLTPELLELTPHPAAASPPGSHVLISIPSLANWSTHPFTPSPTLSGQRLIIRVRSTLTRRLAALAPPAAPAATPATPTAPRDMLPITLDSGYGAPLADLARFDQVLLLAGGVGGTYAVSWLAGLQSASARRVRFVWAVKNPADAAWALEDGHVPGVDAVELYVTGRHRRGEYDGGEDEGAVEMAEGLLGAQEDGGEAAEGAAVEGSELGSVKTHTGRPPIKAIIEATAQAGSVYVLVCGPAMMGAVARRAVARMGRAGRDVAVHVEEFGY